MSSEEEHKLSAPYGVVLVTDVIRSAVDVAVTNPNLTLSAKELNLLKDMDTEIELEVSSPNFGIL